MNAKKFTILVALFFISSAKLYAQPGLIISEVLANPNGTDSPFEFVELIATKSIDFSATPYTVIVNNNGTANANGWIAGGSLSYAFQISTGTVVKGDIVYVGGSSMTVTGTILRSINTATTGGDGGIGNANAGGIFGNGGTNADGVAVFNLSAATITSSSIPEDAIFFGTAIGNALVSAGTAGYELPVNDKYNGGKLQSTSYFGPDAVSSQSLVASGTFNTVSNTYTTPRVFANASTFTDNQSNITIEGAPVESISVTPTSISFTTLINEVSGNKSYILSGDLLTSDVVIESTAPFEIADDTNDTFSNTLTIPFADALEGDTIYVRYNPVASGPHSAIITHTSGSVHTDIEVSGNTLSLTPIYNIQGSSYSSPVVNQTIITEGIITADFQNSDQLKGFFIQDKNGDDNAMTSDGIFVYDNLNGIEVSPLQKVRISGTVKESFGRTQVENITSIVILSSNNTIEPATMPFPFNGVNKEAYESMLVTFSEPLYVSENYNLARYGEITLAKDSFLITPTNYIDPNDDLPAGTNYSGTSNVLAVTEQLSSDSLRTILLDDASNVQNALTIPYLDPVANSLRIGSSFTSLTGIFDYAFGVYRIQPTGQVIEYAERPSVPEFPDANIVAASFNVLNYFNGNGTGGGFPTSRGANNLNELQRQSSKLFAALYHMNADIVGLMEMENDGHEANSGIASFTDGLNAYILTETGTAGNYAYIEDPAFIGTDEIKCAIIYKTDKVEPAGTSLSSTNAVFSRPPVAQVFHVLSTDHNFLFVVNHFKSKGCTDATGNDLDLLDGQSCYNEKRKNQALELVSFINTTLTETNTDKVLTVGDYNAYEQEDPIDALRANDLINLVNNSYSFVFNAQAGSLDHGFVNASMWPHIEGAEKWHINAAEPRLLDYNTEFNPAYVYSPDQFRCSDHDPLLIGMKFESIVTSTISKAKQAGICAVFPSPAEDAIHITGTQEGKRLILFNHLGQTVLELHTLESETVLNIKNLPAGIYTMNYENERIKIVKQ